jgi:1-deoxy-D-xylulose-5-phosphate synthase
LEPLPIGKAELLRQGQRIALLAVGSMVTPAREAGERLDATVVNLRFVKPLDETTIRAVAATHEVLVTLEENAVIGGAGSEIARLTQTLDTPPRLLRLGLPDRFIEHGEQGQLLHLLGLDVDGIVAAIERFDDGDA